MESTQSLMIDASNRQSVKRSKDALLNCRALAPFFTDVDAFETLDEDLKRDGSVSLFTAFTRQFEETTASLFRLNSPRVSFVRFGFERAAPLDDGCLVYLQSDDARFCFAAPFETFLAFLCAALGFDVERICRDEALWRDLTSGRSAAPTALERETLNFASTRLSAYFPDADAKDERAWRGEFFERPTRELRETIGAEPWYWEERVFEVGAKKFPWRLCFPFSNFVGQNASFPVDLESNGVELVAEIARGVVDAERWNNLKPGDVLTTDVDADALFTVLLDGKPTFGARPGVFRGVPSVQLKERVAE